MIGLIKNIFPRFTAVAIGSSLLDSMERQRKTSEIYEFNKTTYINKQHISEPILKDYYKSISFKNLNKVAFEHLQLANKKTPLNDPLLKTSYTFASDASLHPSK